MILNQRKEDDSDPIPRDVFKIIRALELYIIRAKRVKKLKRHFFVKKEEREGRHIASCLCF